MKRKDWSPLDDERSADLYEATQELTDAAGYPAYEISNHARGREHQSAHNRIYWSSGDWVGAGPGAHGRLTAGNERLGDRSRRQPRRISAAGGRNGTWLVRADTARSARTGPRARRHGPSRHRGLRRRPISPRLGLDLDAASLTEFTTLGLADDAADGRIALTRAGRLMADRIAAEISP